MIRVKEMLRGLLTEVVHCGPLIDALIAGLDKRFGQYLTDNRHILAAITLPKFKNLEYLEGDQESKDRFKQILIEKVEVMHSIFGLHLINARKYLQDLLKFICF